MARGGWFLAFWCAAVSIPAQAGEPTERELLAPNAALVLELRQPLQWAGHPLVKQVWSKASQSLQLTAALETPEFQRILAAKNFLETASGRDWEEALSEISAGGIWLGLSPRPDERAMLIIAAAHPDVWTRLESAALKALGSQGQPPESETFRGIKAYRIENSFVAVVGRRLVAASREADLKHILDGLLDRTTAEELKPTAGSGPSITLDANMDSLRRNPEIQKTFKRPADDAGPIAILGGWLDLLRHADRLTATLDWPRDSSEIRLKLAAKDVEPAEPLAGFFARNPQDAPAPLLEPPGTIYSATWFRDYASLWNQRADLLAESAVEKMEKGNSDIRQQFSVFGISFTPSELFQQFGTQFRVVLARAGESEYRVKLENRLPAAAVCVSLRDEQAFLAQAEALSRAIGLIAAFGEAKMLTKTSEHSGARLKGLWFRDDEASAGRGNRLRFNFNPTWTVAREHFVLGSTRDIVAKVIEELDRQTADASQVLETAAGSVLITERQLLSLSQLSEALADFREALLQGSALDRGFTLSEAFAEFDLAKDAINALGRLTTQAAFTEHGFEYEIKIQPGEGTNLRSVPASAP